MATSSKHRRPLLPNALASAALALATGLPALAQSDRPIRFILPVAAASGVDTITRAAVPALTRALGAPIVVENQPGAGGVVGTTALVKSPPDGSTLGIVSNNHVIYPSVLKSIPFDPINDITPIAIIGSTPMVLVVNPKVPAKNVQELVALMKARPDAINYGSSGNGTILHLAAAMFVDQAGAKARHIPYKGTGPMITDLVGGQIDFAVSSLPSVQQHVRNGGLRALAVGAPARLPAAPDIPSAAEQGMPNFLVEGWFALVGPARMPPAEVRRIHAATVAAFASPDAVEAMAKQGNTIKVTTPEEAGRFIRSEMGKYSAIVKAVGLEPQ